MGGRRYTSGYYGYLWAEVIAFDLLSAFDKDMLDPKIGARYREMIPAQGSQDEETNGAEIPWKGFLYNPFVVA